MNMALDYLSKLNEEIKEKLLELCLDRKILNMLDEEAEEEEKEEPDENKEAEKEEE